MNLVRFAAFVVSEAALLGLGFARGSDAPSHRRTGTLSSLSPKGGPLPSCPHVLAVADLPIELVAIKRRREFANPYTVRYVYSMASRVADRKHVIGNKHTVRYVV